MAQTDGTIEEDLPGFGTALVTLISGMLDQGKRRGSLHVRPAINGTPEPYTLRFDVTATMVPDAPQKRRRTGR